MIYTLIIRTSDELSCAHFFVLNTGDRLKNLILQYKGVVVEMTLCRAITRL